MGRSTFSLIFLCVPNRINPAGAGQAGTKSYLAQPKVGAFKRATNGLEPEAATWNAEESVKKRVRQVSFVTFLACPRKVTQRRAPGENSLRRAWSSSGHFGNSPSPTSSGQAGSDSPKCLSLGLGRTPKFSHGVRGLCKKRKKPSPSPSAELKTHTKPECSKSEFIYMSI